MASIGEVHLWPHEIREEGVLPCGSGEYVQNDPFWREMRERIEPLSQPYPQIDHFREEHDAGRTLRISHLREFRSAPLPHSVRSDVLQYADNNATVYHTFLNLIESKEGARPSWVVDSSKDPYRLLWLVRSRKFNVHVIHLVRRPKGFIHSVTKPHIYDDEDPTFRRLFWTIRQAGAWTVRNHLISKVAENHLPSDKYLLLNYEELASSPRTVVMDICDQIDSSYEADAVDNFREGSPYAMAGNPMRQRSGQITLDETWKQNLPLSSRVATNLLTYGFKRKYKY
jgi:hypothetical protein